MSHANGKGVVLNLRRGDGPLVWQLSCICERTIDINADPSVIEHAQQRLGGTNSATVQNKKFVDNGAVAESYYKIVFFTFMHRMVNEFCLIKRRYCKIW